jgi:predicted nucleic acid-binding protein
MGLVLDSGVLIAAERDAKPVSKLLATLEHERGETEIVLSSITVIELEHGLHRAQTAEQERERREYLDTVFAAVPVQPFTRAMAQLAAKIDAEARQLGRTIPFADLLIGSTALHFDYAVGTRNLRHFQMIPNLVIVQLISKG